MNTKLIALSALAVSLAGCSRAVVTMPAAPERTTVQQPRPAAPVATIQAPAQSQTDRIVEIDRMLSAPLTGSPADADRRSALRAERNALMALGNYSAQSNRAGRQATDSQSGQPSSEMAPRVLSITLRLRRRRAKSWSRLIRRVDQEIYHSWKV